MFGVVRELAKYPMLKDYVPFIEYYGDNTLITKGGNLVQVISLTGNNYDTASSDVFMADFNHRVSLFENLEGDIDLVSYAIKERIEFTRDMPNLIGDVESSHAYKICNYLVVSTAIKNNNKIQAIDKLNNFANKITSLYEHFDAHRLNLELLINFWYYIINGNNIEYKIKDKSCLNNIIANSDVMIEDGYIKTNRYMSFMTIKNWSNNSMDISDIWRLDFSFSLSVRFAPTKIEEVIMNLRRKRLSSLLSHFGGKSHQTNEAGLLVESGEEKIISSDLIITIYGDDIDELSHNREVMRGFFGRKGIILYHENINQPFCYFGQLPDYYILRNYRTQMLSVRNLSDLVSFVGASKGISKNSFGNSPVCQFLTPNKTIYNFHFHISDRAEALGHTLIVGGTGSGKTTTTMYMLLQCLKYENMKILAFDSGNGFKIPFKAFNGDYLDLDNHDNVSLNPLLLQETSNNKVFLKKWFELLSGGVEDNEIKIIEDVIEYIFIAQKMGKIPTINNSVGNFGLRDANKGKASIALKLSKWFRGGVYENIFNHERDSLSFSSSLVGFNMGKVINNPELLPVVTSYIFHSFMEHVGVRGLPHICFIDEMSKYLTNPIFARLILENFQELRKRNGVMIGAVQNPSDLSETEIGQKLINNAGNYLLFPCQTMSQAKHYRDAFSLNDREMNFIFNSSNKREILWKPKDSQSVILDVDLSFMGDKLKLLSSSARDINLVAELEKEHKDDWVRHYV
jgi:type IV secretion/conjugal transfer VirB4 family ATPase